MMVIINEHTSGKGNENDGENENMMETAGSAEQEEQEQLEKKEDRMKEGVECSLKENVCNAMNEHQNKATCSFDQLPNELVSNILETALRCSKPSNICVLFQWLKKCIHQILLTVLWTFFQGYTSLMDHLVQ